MNRMEFRWNEWNLEHATQHGVSIEEIEALIDAAEPPYPEDVGDDKLMVVGRGSGGRFVQAIYVLDEDGSLYVIHARPLADHEKRRFRRRMR
jgi:uncharacterized DUF497 family protein